MFCGADTTTWPDICKNRVQRRTDEIEREINREINATRVGYSVVIEATALGGAGKTWLGGSDSYAGLAQSAIDFGRNVAKLSAKVRSRIQLGFLV